MIDGAAPRGAPSDPAPHVAMFHRLRIVVTPQVFGTRGNCGFELRTNESVIRGVILCSIRVDRSDRIRRHDVEVLRHPFLDAPEHRRVRRELQDGAGAGCARELRVPYLVRPRAKGAGDLDAPQHVRVAAPLPVIEPRLDEYLDAL